MNRSAILPLMRRHGGLMRIGNLGTIYSSQRSCYPSDGSLSKRFSSTAAPANKNSGVPNGNNNSSFFQLFMIGCTAVAAASTFRFSACSEGTGGASAFEPTTLPSHSDIDLPQMKPLWPDGVSEADVDDLVEVILQDPSINIALIPDSIEAAIYKSTIRLTLNIFYRLLSRLNGVSLLSHQIKVARIQQSNDGDIELIGRSTDRFASKNHKRITAVALKSNARVNDQVLETVAERLLANRAINHTLIPDAIELQLYQNCLKVIFRALQILSNSFHINICGHDIQLSIEPSSLEQSALAATSSSPSNFRMGSEIDMELLQEFAFRAGIPKDGSVELSWWDEVLSRRRFVASLHASLYSLVLGIVDDILQHSNIKILSDDIYLDITPPDTKRPLTAKTKDMTSRSADNTRTALTPTDWGPSIFASFAAGIGVGIGFMAFFMSRP